MASEDRTDFIVCGVTISFALFGLFVLIPFGVEDPGAIDVLALGPAFWPSIICVFVGAMGAITGFNAWRRTRLANPVEDSAEARFHWPRWLGAVVLLAGMYTGLHLAGMVLTCILGLLLFILLGGERRPLLLAGIALGLPLTLYYFFRYVANVAIPLGVLEPWLV